MEDCPGLNMSRDVNTEGVSDGNTEGREELSRHNICRNRMGQEGRGITREFRWRTGRQMNQKEHDGAKWFSLLYNLKSTVEGLLCMPCVNVWSVYGGLQRVTNNVHDILNHQLNYSCSQSIYDRAGQLWKVLRGLKYLDPVLSPFIDKIARDDAADDEGRAWIEQSLLRFTLTSQIMTLVNNSHYLRQFYNEEAFILQAEYTDALIVCLQAVELNRAALLADINPHLLSKKSLEETHVEESKPPSPIKGPLSPVTSPVRTKPLRHDTPQRTLVRSNSLPEDWFSEARAEEMGRRTTLIDRLAPPIRVPTVQDTASLSEQYAMPDSYGSSSDESARDALIQVLNNSGESFDELPSRDSGIQSNGTKDAPLFPVTNNKTVLSNLAILPNMDSVVVPTTKYSKNITHLSAFNPQSPVLRLKRRSNRNISSLHGDRLSVITKAVSAEVLDRILNDDIDIVKIHEQSQENPPTSETETETLQNVASTPRLDLKVPNYSVERITTQPEISCPASPIRDPDMCPIGANVDDAPLSAIDSPDSGYATLRKNTKDHEMARATSQSAIVESKVQESANRKSSHYRSMSDYGVPFSFTSSQVSNQNNSNRSSSISDLPKQDRAPRFFHQPQQGESLIGFLSSQDFHTAAELDKENAHLSICETLIAAIEQMKVNHVLDPCTQTDDVVEGDSDEEIQQLKQRIRIRRRERMREKARGFPAFSDGRTDTTTTSSQSVYESLEDSFSSQDSSSSSEEVHDTNLNEADDAVSRDSGSLSRLRTSGLSLSMASLYNDAELQKSNARAEQRRQATPVAAERPEELGGVLPDGTLVFTQSAQVSAESVAISLLKRFSEQQLPKASDLEWLVSEQDAPQQLLPLPDSYPVSPDDYENADLLASNKSTRLRGNLEWAPPRAQIIFNVHPSPKRHVLMASQNFRCAGCGTKVQPAYMKRYRYCEYLGKYFCPCCHSNDVAYIPGRVIRKWDFSKYSVSHFARDLLAKIENEPLFNVEDLNPALYKKVRALEQIRDYRKQLLHLVAFLKTCRMGTQLLTIIEGEPSHWTIDPHMYTLRELVNVKKALLLPRIRSLITEALAHVQQCQLCQAKGFICELCSDSSIIFPFDLDRVLQCDLCRACYHTQCYVPDKCPKCARIELRRMRVNEAIVNDED